MKRLVVAARYLTILPLPAGGGEPPERLGRAAAWFPVVGLGLGVTLVAVDAVTRRLFPGLLAALLTVTVWKLLTGGLHLDGLADCLDGLMGTDSEQRLAIMRDSRIGAFGAIGLIFFLLLEIAAVGELTGTLRWRALLVVPGLARAMPPFLARRHPAARPGGQGAAFRDDVTRSGALVALAIALALAALVLGGAGLVAFAAACVTTVGLGRFLAGRLGGLSGDVLGAAVESAELAALLAVSAWAHAIR